MATGTPMDVLPSTHTQSVGLLVVDDAAPRMEKKNENMEWDDVELAVDGVKCRKRNDRPLLDGG